MVKKIFLLCIIFNTFLIANDDKIKLFKIDSNDIEINIIHPKYITRGEKIRFVAMMKNKSKNAYMGGLTISFPQFKYSRGNYSHNTFDTINSYGPPGKIYSSILKKNVKSKYFMVEGWENNWKKGVEKSFYVEINLPKHIDNLIINVRGILVFGKYKKDRTEIKLPTTSNYKDQQEYPIRQFSIPIHSKKSFSSKKNEVTSSTGTGFFINPTNIITNQHVINSCNNITIVKSGIKFKAKINAIDKINDLAILTVNKKNKNYLKFRNGKKIRIGESIIAMGYPLGSVLGSNIKLTTGNISSLTGLLNDTTTLQLTAPVQPGNSGGPLLDYSGNVVGIIYAKLNNNVAQNVNLAIKSNILTMFLDANEIDYFLEQNTTKKEIVDIADKVKKGIVQVICK